MEETELVPVQVGLAQAVEEMELELVQAVDETELVPVQVESVQVVSDIQLWIR